uniref:Uncharacterized protein n=1 Tax=Opuntia streptacantha TaxID=393608 RepID=A0A7C9D5C9_OPUST
MALVIGFKQKSDWRHLRRCYIVVIVGNRIEVSWLWPMLDGFCLVLIISCFSELVLRVMEVKGAISNSVSIPFVTIRVQTLTRMLKGSCYLWFSKFRSEEHV